MKLCKDCRHRSKIISWFSKCNAPQNRIVSPVTGKWKHGRWKYCDEQRVGLTDHESCGAIGAWWEPRPPSGFQRVIKIFSRS